MTPIALTIVGSGRFGAADMQSDLKIFKPRNVAPPELKTTRNLAMQTTDQDPQAKARAWHVITPGGRHREAAGKLPGIRQIIAVGSAKGGIGKSPARTSGTKVNALASS